MGVGAQPKPGNVIESHTVQLVERILAITARAAASQVGIDRDVLNHLNPRSRAEALKKIFVEQPGADQGWIEGRDIAKVIVVEVQFNSRRYLHAHGKEIAAQARAG